MRLGPDDLSAQLKPAGGQIAADHIAVQRPVPHISDIPGKQRVGLPPVGAVIVEHLALRELAGADPTAGSPGRIIADPIRGSLTISWGCAPASTGSTSAALMLSPQPTQWSPNRQMSPGTVTG